MSLNPRHIATPPTYKKTVLPNGIRIVTEELTHVRSITVGAWMDVGSRHEDDRTNGISHFLEHMVFKGTEKLSIQGIAHSLESVGGYLNAFTTKEHTCFYARILDEHLDRALSVLSQLTQHPTFPAKELEKEKQVVIEEIKTIDDDPDDLIHDYFDKALYRRHPLALPVIGTVDNISALNRDVLMGHLEEHYAPERTVITAAGNLTHEQVVMLVDKYFTAPRRKVKPRVNPPTPRLRPGTKETYDKPIMQAHVCLGTIGYGVKSPHRYPLLVMNTLLGDGMSSRLFQNIREKYGFAYSVYSFTNTMSDTGNFGVYIGTDKDKVEKSIGLIFKELEKLAGTPVKASELSRAKAQVKGSMMLSLENTSNRMMRLGSNELFYNKFYPVDEIIRKIDAVTVEEVHAVAAQLLKPEMFSTVVISPSGSSTKN